MFYLTQKLSLLYLLPYPKTQSTISLNTHTLWEKKDELTYFPKALIMCIYGKCVGSL